MKINLEENKNSLEKFNFEISLVIIAILIPLFLDTVPSLVDKIINLFNVPLNLNLKMVNITFIFLGLMWFFVLLIGLIEFDLPNRRIFHTSFSLGIGITLSLISFIILIYFIYFIYLLIGNGNFISLVLLLFGILIGIIPFMRKQKNEQTK